MENRDVILENARQLICENGFNKVTVKMICERSKISRKTFYTFYQDKYEILEQILVKDVIIELDELLDKFGKVELNRPIILEAMYQRIYDNGEFYRKTIDTEGDNSLGAYFLHYLIKMNHKILMDSEMSAVERDYATYFYAAAQVMFIKKWILDDYNLTPEEMAEYYQKWAVCVLIICRKM